MNNENITWEDSNDEDDLEPEEIESTRCLFCEENFKSVDVGIIHLRTVHSFNLAKLKTKFNMDQYSYIKLINFIRIHKIEAKLLAETEEIIWNEEKYLKPLKYETWLTYDFEEGIMSTTLTESEELDKDFLIRKMVEEIETKNLHLKQATDDIHQIRKGFKRLLKDSMNNNSYKRKDSIESNDSRTDDGYFKSYAHFDIHHQMLSDSIRTNAYRDAFLKNKPFVSGKTVLDIGSGTSILSMFASLAGAKEVVGVDNSEIIYNAMEIIKKNNFNNIKLVKGKVENTKLPIDKFDIIVSEWMGYFLIFEGMLDSVIYCRNNYLKKGGTLMPNRCTMSLVAYGNEKRYDEYITFWDSVYGFDMSSIKSEVLREPNFEICDPKYILTEEMILIDYDLNTVSLDYSNFDCEFNLKCKKSGSLTSFMGYFDTYFELSNPVHFSTSALSAPTHWKQAIFYLDEKVIVEEGEIISGKIICKRDIKNIRSIIVKITVFGKEFVYNID